MKAKKIYYKKLINLGNFSNEEIGIEIEIEKGETAQDALNKAKEFVEKNNPRNLDQSNYNDCLHILKNPDQFMYSKVKEAEKFVNEYEAKKEDDLPF
ncbi:MAG: hypothetical protein WC389_22060 [Lutibacter sp.]|jgi:hypothetical protein